MTDPDAQHAETAAETAETARTAEQLREIFDAIDPPPRYLVDFAKASLSLRDLDAELAELTSDSSTEATLAMRATAPPRLLTFVAADTTVVVEITSDDASRSLFGQLVAPAAAQVQIRHSAGTAEVSTDREGRFRATEIAAGPVSISCRFDDPGRQPVVTAWVTV